MGVRWAAVKIGMDLGCLYTAAVLGIGFRHLNNNVNDAIRSSSAELYTHTAALWHTDDGDRLVRAHQSGHFDVQFLVPQDKKHRHWTTLVSQSETEREGAIPPNSLTLRWIAPHLLFSVNSPGVSTMRPPLHRPSSPPSSIFRRAVWPAFVKITSDNPSFRFQSK
jgi:hypothetical protein